MFIFTVNVYKMSISVIKYNYNILVLVLFATSNICVHGSNDPYTILGINNFATTQEIRKAYKQLAKEW